MAEKDVTEKILEANNDVFFYIINGCLYQGEQVIYLKIYRIISL